MRESEVRSQQKSPTLGIQMFLDFNSQKSWPAKVVVKASGSCSPRTLEGPRLGTTELESQRGELVCEELREAVESVELIES